MTLRKPLRFQVFSGMMLVMIFTLGCERVFDDEKELEVMALADSFLYGSTFELVIKNPTPQAVYYRRCGGASFRYRMVKVEGDTEIEVVEDRCTSFNQQILEVASKSEVVITFPLSFSHPPDVSRAGTYYIELFLMSVTNQPIDPPANRTKTFQVTTTN